jgi:hypothetical protein
MTGTGFDAAALVADTVLYEGYLLYPYRASSQKNQMRWQWGVLVPREQSEAAGERWASQTEVLVEPRGDAVVHVRGRCLQLETRSGSVPWDEGHERQVDVAVPLEPDGTYEVPFVLPAGETCEDGVTRHRHAVDGVLLVTIEHLPGPYGVVKVRARVENRTGWFDSTAARDEVVRHSLVGAHVLLAVSAGRFLSMVDPPEWAQPYVDECANEGTWPVLVGDGDTVMLSSPIILDEHPQIAPESAGPMYDATEIDEILSLRTLTLTDEEKAEARATDPRAAAVIDQVDTMGDQILGRLHGVMRDLPSGEPGSVPWWDPGADQSVSPDTDAVEVAGIEVRRGARVRLIPGPHADAQDIFLRGRIAQVEAVLFDVDQGTHLAVILEDDPGADIRRIQGRFLYFAPEEVEPL